MDQPYRTPEGANAAAAAPTAPTAPHSVQKRYNVWLRAVLVWVLLVVLIIALRELLSSGDGAPELPVSPVLLVAVFFLLFLGFFVAMRRKLVALARDNDEAVALLGAGETARAAGVFDRLVRESGRWPKFQSMFLMNLGMAQIRLGEHKGAVKSLTTVHEAGWFKGDKLFQVHTPNVIAGIALAEALAGNVKDAERWNQQAQSAATQGTQRGRIAMADAVVAMRAGRMADALAGMEAGWSMAEGALTATQMRAMRVLRAFALDTVRGEAGESEKRAMLEGARPSQSGEFAHLYGAWPELEAFMRAHDFS